jgi:hypothetical protein
LNRGIKSSDSIKLSSASRQKLAALRAEAAKMDTLFQEEKKRLEKGAGKKGQGLLLESQLSEKQTTLHLVRQHVEECDLLEKGGAGKPAPASASRSALLTPQGDRISGRGFGGAARPLGYESELGAIDPEVQAGLLQIEKQDALMDQSLDQIMGGVRKLKAIALDISTEVKTQEVMINEIDLKLEMTGNKLDAINVKLKKALDEVGGASRIILNVILLILAIALGVYAYESFKGGGVSNPLK